MFVRFVLALSALAFVASAPSTTHDASAPTRRVATRAAAPTVVILVRHAEKANEPASDPPLTDAGTKRAEALAQVVRDAGVSAVVTTQFARTRLTAQPAAKAIGIEPMVIAAGGTAAAHAQVVADSIKRRFAGRTVLVVGHSNTIPAIVGALGAPRPADLCDAEYDQLFVVILGEEGGPRLVRSRYGAASDVSACAATK